MMVCIVKRVKSSVKMVSETDRNTYPSKDHLPSMVNALLGCLNKMWHLEVNGFILFSTSKKPKGVISEGGEIIQKL